MPAGKELHVSQVAHDVATEGAKLAPVGAVSGAMIFGIPVADWIAWATLLYLLGLIGLMIPKYWALACDFVARRRARP